MTIDTPGLLNICGYLAEGFDLRVKHAWMVPAFTSHAMYLYNLNFGLSQLDRPAAEKAIVEWIAAQPIKSA